MGSQNRKSKFFVNIISYFVIFPLFLTETFSIKIYAKKKYLAFMVGDGGGIGGPKRTSTYEKVDLIKTLHIDSKNNFISEHKL